MRITVDDADAQTKSFSRQQVAQESSITWPLLFGKQSHRREEQCSLGDVKDAHGREN